MGVDNRRAKDLSYLAFNFFSTIAVTFINKICFSRVEFGFPAALCNIHFLVTWVGVEMLRRCGMFETVKVRVTDRNFLLICFLVGVVTPLNNTSLKLNSVGFYQIFKLLVTPVVVLLEYLWDRKTLSTARALCLMGVCGFVLFSSKSDVSFSPYGMICASLWVPLAAAYKVQWGRVRKQYNTTTLALMYAVLPYAIVVQALVSPLVDPPGILEFVWTPNAIMWIGLSGIAAFLVNFSGFLVMGNIGALAHVLLGQVKTAVIMFGAFFLFASTYSEMQLLGAAGAVVMIVFYTHVTLREKEGEKTRAKDDTTLPLIDDSAASTNGPKVVQLTK
eukprot:CAMPEP_0194057440 /NCGR_PEP_ID=MMETSP0009_2-20130614/63392_1 /TAXON_ID=210454 /ORGANISM="Grammatophora oceanica, Strain CCMP 410" /LENGTH=331 /DNA_ID=CAMNT_0038707203 /DNA_START=65 /DNA_END=1060 /DNA_ORIENTATION=+